MFEIMDYLYIGSNGFAQIGQFDFYQKNKVEMAVLMDYLENNHPIPDEFSMMCRYKVKWFQHDFGDYSEIVLIYNDGLLDRWEENEPDKFNRFWNWFNDIESVNLESEALTEIIESRYLKLSDAALMNRAVRKHWHIENKLHWVLDVLFKEDYCRVRTGNGAENLTTIRK
jgi:hypothetical protein